MDFDFEMNTGDVQRVLKKLPDATAKKVVRLAVGAGARVIRDAAKQLAPYDPSRKTGTHLRDAIVARKVPRTNDLYNVGTLSRVAPHAHLLEFGTVKMPPAPFLRPAAAYSNQKVAVKMIKIIGNGILREARKLSGVTK